jgi:uncharacterized RDD family membrane protein YckC/Tfp pilus assembly major pilin PilA
MHCTQCGAANAESSLFCVQCGVALQRGPVVSATTPKVFAGFWIRVGAYLIDYVILTIAAFIAMFVLGLALGAFTGVPSAGSGIGLFLAWLLFPWLYAALFESGPRQATLGKQAVNLKVTDLGGNRISFGRATGRYFAEWITGLTFGIGYVMAAFTAKRQSLHDMIAGTVVVRADLEPAAIADAPPAGRRPAWQIALIVLAAFIPLLGILAAIAIPAYQDFTIRAQVAEGLVLASELKSAVVEHAALTGDWPADLEDASFNVPVEASAEDSCNVESFYISNGTITIVYGRNASARIRNATLSLRPYVDRDGEVVWQCGRAARPDGTSINSAGESGEGTDSDPGETDLADKYLPASCRSGYDGP